MNKDIVEMKDILLTALLSAFLTSGILITVDIAKHSKCEKGFNKSKFERHHGFDKKHHDKDDRFGKHHKKPHFDKYDLYKKYDTDGDGQFSKEEYLKMKQERFDDLDTNKDGILTREEMKQAREKAHKKFRKMMKEKGADLPVKGDMPPPPPPAPMDEE